MTHPISEDMMAPIHVDMGSQAVPHLMAGVGQKAVMGQIVRPFSSLQLDSGYSALYWKEGFRGRSSVAYYKNSSLQLVQVAADVYRENHYFDENTVGALVEGESRNVFANSEVLNGNMSNYRATWSADATTAPDGTTTAEKMVEDTTPAISHCVLYDKSNAEMGQLDNTPLSYSIFLKAGERTQVRFRVRNQENISKNIYYDLTDGSFISESGSLMVTHSSEKFTGGWYRYKFTFNSSYSASPVNPYFIVYLLNGNGDTIYDGDGTSGIYAWGFQVEVNSNSVSSYIKTTGSSAARAADRGGADYQQISAGNYPDAATAARFLSRQIDELDDFKFYLRAVYPDAVVVDSVDVVNVFLVGRDKTTKTGQSCRLFADSFIAEDWTKFLSMKYAIEGEVTKTDLPTTFDRGIGTNLVADPEDPATGTSVRVSVTADAALAPDGGSKAALLTDTADNSNHYWYEAVSYVEFTGEYIAHSVFIKAAPAMVANNDFSILIQVRSFAAEIVYFPIENLNGELSLGSAYGTTSILISNGLEDYGDGWYRFKAVILAGSGTSTVVLIYPRYQGSYYYAGVLTPLLYFWGWKIEDSRFVTPYVSPNSGWISDFSHRVPEFLEIWSTAGDRRVTLYGTDYLGNEKSADFTVRVG